jgi:hypothetical protein
VYRLSTLVLIFSAGSNVSDPYLFNPDPDPAF